ncbi:MAG: multiheme c-type cytochrome [Opitutales bacterium]
MALLYGVGCSEKPDESAVTSPTKESLSDTQPAAEALPGFPESHNTARMDAVGVATCVQCHAEAVAAWETSDHALANRPVSVELDKAAFEGTRTVTEGDTVYRMAEQNGQFWVHVKEGEKPMRSYELTGVIGYEPLRQYLAELPGNKFQTLSASYDVIEDEWFHVFEGQERRPGEWGHWRGQGMNWNANCAECHTTEYHKNFDFDANAYQSSWTEQGIACAECHTGLDEHVKGAQSGDLSILPKLLTRQQTEHTCAACHSRRDELTANEFVPGENYYDHYALMLPYQPGLYYPDGQILDEVFVYTSFQMSRMAHAGVSCMDCHDHHTLKLKLPVENNALCMQCHETGNMKAPLIEPLAHSFHAEGSTGNQCVSCHMRQTPYMQVDPRADHGFHSPDPLLTKEQGIPNACSQCHEDQSIDWAVEWAEKWYGEKLAESRQRKRARAIEGAYNGTEPGFRGLLELVKDEEIPAWKATYAGLLMNYGDNPEIREIMASAAVDPHPLVRERAASSIGVLPAPTPETLALLKDERLNVRITATRAAFLVGEKPEDPGAAEQLEAYFAFHEDRPMTLFIKAQEAQRAGRSSDVLKYVDRAVMLDEENAEMYRQAAILLSGSGFNERAADLLHRGKNLAPENPMFAYSLGLLAAEDEDMESAIEWLREAVRLDPMFTRAWYNLSLALNHSGQTEEAQQAMMRVQQLQNSGY